MNENDDSRVYPRLLPDGPVAADAFGGHDALAEALWRLVRTTPGGRAVALEGHYGSGKSTVIRLLDSKIGDNQDVLLWTFDAWAHEGDPLRRTFLEDLATHLKKRSWISAKTWDAELNLLARRTQVTKSTTAPGLTKSGGAVAASVLLIPFGTTIFAEALSRGMTLWGGPTIDWLGVLGGVLMAAPAIAAATVAAGAKFGLIDSPEWDDHGVLSLFVHVQRTKGESKTVADAEPTSLEFKRLFDRMMVEALGEATDRRILIALDNLDRIGVEYALSIWSTLQTFLSAANAPSGWWERVWLFVLHDRRAVRELWSSNGESPTSARASDASAFLDKTFDAQFVVPPPVLSDQGTYLAELLNEAFGPVADKIATEKTYRVFASRRDRQIDPPTPREMKNFVNDVVGLALQHGTEIPLPHLAYAAALRREDEDIVEGLRQGTLPEEHSRRLLGKSIADDLATVEYGVPPAVARQLLLRGPIREALESGASAELQVLFGQSTGAGAVIERVIAGAADGWADSPKPGLLKPARALLDSGVWEELGTPARAGISRDFSRSLGSQAEWNELDEEAVAGLIAVSALVDAQNFDRELFGTVERTLVTIADSHAEHGDAPPPDELAAALCALVSGFDPLPSGLGRSVLVLPRGVDELIRLRTEKTVRSLPEEKRDQLLELVGTQESDAEVLAYFTNANFDKGPHDLQVLHQLVDERPSAAWDEVSQALAESLTAERGSPGNRNVLGAIAALDVLRPAQESDDELEESVDHVATLARGGHLAHQIELARELGQGDDKELVARLVLANPSLTRGPTPGRAVAGYEHAGRLCNDGDEVVAQILVNDASERESMDVIEGLGTPELRNRALDELVSRPWFSDALSPDFVMSEWPTFDGADDALDSEALLQRTLRTPGVKPRLSAHIVDTSFDESDAYVYLVLLSHGSSTRAFREWTSSGLRSVDASTWESALREDSLLLDLAIELHRRDNDLSLGKALASGAEAHAGSLLSGTSGSIDAGKLDAVLDTLEQSMRVYFRDQVWEQCVNVADPQFDEFRGLYGDEFLASKKFRTRSDTVTRILQPIIDARDAANLEWIRDELESDPSLFAELPPEYCDVLVADLEDVSEDDEVSEICGEILRRMSRK